ncbi:MAG: TetR/AcrR family transcriptional regulator [Acidobacteriota bacterium]
MTDDLESQPPSSPRSRILDAAAQAFAEHGFEGAGVDDIARRAGVNKAMLYYHVGDKAALYAAVTTDYLGQVKQAIESQLRRADTPVERLRAMQRGFLAVFEARPEFPRLMLREIASGGTHLPAEALAGMAGVMALTRTVVERGQSEGAFRAVDPLLTHLLVVGSALFIVNAQRLRPRLDDAGVLPEGVPNDFLAVADRVADIILYGIAAAPTGGHA